VVNKFFSEGSGLVMNQLSLITIR